MQAGRKREASDTVISTSGGTNTCGLTRAAQNAVTTLLKFPKPTQRVLPAINTYAATH